jgi:hypothetical protein
MYQSRRWVQAEVFIDWVAKRREEYDKGRHREDREDSRQVRESLRREEILQSPFS